MHRQCYLIRVEDDGSHTDVGQYANLTAAVSDGEDITAYEDFDFSYEVYSVDGTRLAQIHPGRVGYRAWLHRRDEYIGSLDDRYDKDEDELLIR